MTALKLHRAHSLSTSQGTLRYLSHEPPGFGTEPRPLVLFLHGAGERGGDLARVCATALPSLIEQGRNVPFVAVSPHCPLDTHWTALTPALKELVSHVTAELHIDPRRIYLTGISMGGFGVWKLAADAPELFAALVPICGGGDPSWAARLKQLPTWAFHGEDDRVVPPSATLTMISALEREGAPVKLTLYPGVGHDSWTETYQDPALYDWLLKQQRHERAATASAHDDGTSTSGRAI